MHALPVGGCGQEHAAMTVPINRQCHFVNDCMGAGGYRLIIKCTLYLREIAAKNMPQ